MTIREKSFTVEKCGAGSYVLTIGDNRIDMDGADMRALLEEIASAIAVDVSTGPGPVTRAFLDRLRSARDVGVQALLHVAAHEDVVALMKAAEEDTRALDKLHANMSGNARKMFEEDVAFRFREGVPGSVIDAAIRRLEQAVRTLENEGTPVFN